MNRSLRQGLMAVVVALITLWLIAPSARTLMAQTTNVEISGQTLQLFNNQPRVFEPYNATTKTLAGLSYPVSLICPGNIDLAATFSGQPGCAENPATSTANGFRGWVVTEERVVRDYTNPLTPTFEFSAVLSFSGSVFLEGEEYFGSTLIRMEVDGPLIGPIDGIDCTVTPDNALCGAASFTGTYEIIQNSGRGELSNLTGGGTISWVGCLDPTNPATCAFPTYDGNLSISYTATLPLIGSPTR